MSENHPHYVWALVAVGTIGLVAWIYSSNRPDVDNLAKGAIKVETHDTYWPFAISIGQGGCTHMSDMKGKNGITTNSAK